jgi:hypothetical protein
MDLNKMRNEFNKAILLLIGDKRDDNKSFMNNEEYDRRMEDVKLSKIKKKCKRDYRNIRKYDVILINDKERLIKAMNHDNDGIRYYVKNEELFDILHSTHIAIGHGGRDRMMAEIKLKYCNITKETIMIFLSLCTDCHKKSSNPKRGLVSKPILHSAYNSRAQIDIIDMQSQCKTKCKTNRCACRSASRICNSNVMEVCHVKIKLSNYEK